MPFKNYSNITAANYNAAITKQLNGDLQLSYSHVYNYDSETDTTSKQLLPKHTHSCWEVYNVVFCALF